MATTGNHGSAKMECWETASSASETSAAVVSLYNSWSNWSDAGAGDDGDWDDSWLHGHAINRDVDGGEGIPLQLVDFSDSSWLPPFTPVNAHETLQDLKKRLRDEDLPPTPLFRKRVRVTCRFENYLGRSRFSQSPPPPVMPPALPVVDELAELGLAETDALFPLKASSVLPTVATTNKFRHDYDGAAETTTGLAALDRDDMLLDAAPDTSKMTSSMKS